MVKKTEISLKSRDAIIYMVKKLTKRYENLKKHKTEKGFIFRQYEVKIEKVLWVPWIIKRKGS